MRSGAQERTRIWKRHCGPKHIKYFSSMRNVCSLALATFTVWGCTPATVSEANACGAAASYLRWEISHLIDEELVFVTRDYNPSLSLSALSEPERARAINLFSQMDWIDLRGETPWVQHVRPKMVAKTSEEIAMVRALFDQDVTENAVTRCSGVNELLQSKAIAFGDKAVGASIASKDPETDEYTKTIAGSYMPLLSKDRASAVLFASRSWAPLAGGELVIKIARQKSGEWAPTGVQVLTVS